VLPYGSLGVRIPATLSPVACALKGHFGTVGPSAGAATSNLAHVMHSLLAVAPGTVPLWAWIGVATVAGLMVGSFLNVVVYRVPRSLSISAPRSFCPRCRRQLTWWENVPVASWIALGGRCRSCRTLISPRYPLVELGTAAVFGIVAWRFSGALLTIPYCVLAATLFAVLMIDAGDLRSPLGLAASGSAIADLLLVVATSWHGQWAVLIGGQVGIAIGVGCFAALRSRDPECEKVPGIGRSALIPLGCWLGGLGIDPSLWGAGSALILCCTLSLTGVAADRGSAPMRPTPAGRQIRSRVLSRPLLISVGVAAVASLFAAH